MAWWIFQHVVSTAVLAGVIALACRYARIGPVARHALWVLVLVKFITPPVIVWPWAVPDPLGIGAIVEQSLETRVVPTEMMPVPVEDLASIDAPSIAIDGVRQVPEGAPPMSEVSWLVGVWVLGSVCLITIEGLRIARLRRRRRPMPADHPIASHVHALASQFDLRSIPVDLVAGLSSPVVWGLGRPRLLWPAALETIPSDASLDGIVVHELAHVKRGDHLVGWIELAAAVVWWWNPLFWSVRSARREQAELACDAWVISALPNGRRAYAESLLLLSGAVAPDSSPMTTVGIRPGSRRVLERRLVMIMKGRSSLRLPWVGLCSLALVAAATLPAWASAQQPPPPPPPAPVPVTTPRTMPPPPPPAPQVNSQVIRKTPPAPPMILAKPQITHTVKQAPSRPVVIKGQKGGDYLYAFHTKPLPEDGQKLLETFEADSKAIQEEANRKMEERRASAVKALEVLQEQYTKAGKLDEAVAIRDFLRAGGPLSPLFHTIRYAVKK